MKKFDKRKNQAREKSNGNYVASLNGTASAIPPKQLFSQQLKQPTLQRKATHETTKGEGKTQELKTTSKEYQYQIALALANYDTVQVQGFDEFKPGGFRYNPSKSYNLAIIERQLGYQPLTAQNLGEYWADPSTEAGRVMKNQHHNHARDLMYRRTKKAYQPSNELLARQIFQQLGEEQVRNNTIATLQYCQDIKKAIQLKIKDEATPINEKNNYLAKDTKMDAAINQLLAAISGVSEQEFPEVAKANFAIPIGRALSATLGAALVAGTALTLLMTVLFRDVHDTLEDVVDAALDDLLRDTGVGQGKKGETTPDPNKTPKPLPPHGETKDKDCELRPVGRHLGGDPIHNYIADKEPPNTPDKFGQLGDWNVKGKNFDAYNRGKRELWEIKTNIFEKYNAFLKRVELKKQVNQIKEEYRIAMSCGYGYVVGVTSKENYDLLITDKDLTLLNVTIKYLGNKYTVE